MHGGRYGRWVCVCSTAVEVFTSYLFFSEGGEGGGGGGMMIYGAVTMFFVA